MQPPLTPAALWQSRRFLYELEALRAGEGHHEVSQSQTPPPRANPPLNFVFVPLTLPSTSFVPVWFVWGSPVYILCLAILAKVFF